MKEKLERIIARGKFCIKKNSPDILIATGIVGIVAGAVSACRATRKIDAIIDEHKRILNDIHSSLKDEEIKKVYSEKDARKDITITYFQTGVKIVKLYFPAIILDAASIVAILTGKSILKKRYSAMATAYKIVDSQFKRYRENVIEKYGKDEDRKLRFGLKDVEEKTVGEDGKTKDTKEKKETIDAECLEGYSDYARFFDSSSAYYEKDPENNLIFLRSTQNYWNNKLKICKRVFLNEVYESLGLPKTKAGQVVGWVYDESNPDIDNYIDFGIYDICKSKARDFVNGYESVILLDFNVDGNVWENM